MGNFVHLTVAGDVFDVVFFCYFVFQRDVFDEICDWIESIPEIVFDVVLFCDVFDVLLFCDFVFQRDVLNESCDWIESVP